VHSSMFPRLPQSALQTEKVATRANTTVFVRIIADNITKCTLSTTLAKHVRSTFVVPLHSLRPPERQCVCAWSVRACAPWWQWQVVVVIIRKRSAVNSAGTKSTHITLSSFPPSPSPSLFMEQFFLSSPYVYLFFVFIPIFKRGTHTL